MKKFLLTTRGNSHHTSKAKRVFLGIGIFLFCLVLFYAVPKVVSSLASFVFIPIHSVESWIAYSSDALPQFFRDRDALLTELNSYKYAESAQSGDKLTADLLSSENRELRALLSEGAEERILAGVISRPNIMPYDVLVLDKGSEDGVLVGAPVFIGENVVIGVVEKVFNSSAVVVLVTTPELVSSVYIVGPNIYTNAEGVGGGLMRIGVPQGIPLAVGNPVILVGVDSGIYGRISHVESIPSEPEQSAYVSPEVPLSGLRLVSVGKTSTSQLTFQEAEKIVQELKQTVFTVPIPEGVLVSVASTSATSTATTTQTP